MDILFEIILELVFEGTLAASKSRRIPKFIRYPLIVIIALLFIAVIGIMFLTGILAIKENLLFGIFLILLGVFMLVTSVFKFRKKYLTCFRDQDD